MTLISSLNIPDTAKHAIIRAGYTTVAELEARRIGPHGCIGRLTLIRGITPKLEMQVEEALHMLGDEDNHNNGADPVKQESLF